MTTNHKNKIDKIDNIDGNGTNTHFHTLIKQVTLDNNKSSDKIEKGKACQLQTPNNKD